MEHHSTMYIRSSNNRLYVCPSCEGAREILKAGQIVFMWCFYCHTYKKFKIGDPMENKREVWVMPEWMEPYRKLIGETGGNPIEELMNDRDSNAFNNVIRAGLIVCANAQVSLLMRLYQRHLITGTPSW